MTAYNIYMNAMKLLGYDTEGLCENDILKNVVFIVNTVLNDLSLGAVERVQDQIQCTLAQQQAVIFGMAAIIAMTSGDSEKYNMMSTIYLEKRRAVKSCVQKIKDVFPAGED